jgi:F-type H+-transporting ATPase subunit b
VTRRHPGETRSGCARRSRLTGLILLAAIFLAAPPTLAAEEGHHGPSSWLLALQIVNGIILVAILVRYARRPLRNFMAQRRHEIQSGIQEAQARLDAAETDLARWRGRLEEIEEETAEILRAAEQQAEAERRRALERAEANAQRVREEAEKVADQEIERARSELRSEAAELATRLASDVVRRSLTPADHRRLVDDVIERVGGSA